MTYTYKLLGNHAVVMGGGPINAILRKEDGAWIPKDTNNTDYQDYLEWVSEGNTAEAAD
tara:strand:+ start:307 stop:483 length:177 start_codon:yes stop_codon:yes gene_type:complete